MRTIIAALAASALRQGRLKSGPDSRPPNYVTSHAAQAPALRNDTFGGAAMPMRGLPR